MSKLPPGEDFEGTTSDMRTDNPWLASEDLIGAGDVKVTISAVKLHRNAEFEGGRKESVYALHFDKATKALVLNATNRAACALMFGTRDVRKWVGKTITLYVEKLAKPAFGKRTHGIRIRNTLLEKR